MGGVDKCRLRLGGRSLLDWVLHAARQRCDSLVVVGPRRPTTVAGVRFVQEPSPGGGPVPAVAAGVATVGDANTVVVLAADLPLVTAADLDRLLAPLADPGVAAVAAVDRGGRPHPLLVAHTVARLRERLAELGPDQGRAVPASRLLPPDVVAVEVGPHATLNVNDATDLRRARALVDSSRA
jgi:molybdopterin molybdotransferase